MCRRTGQLRNGILQCVLKEWRVLKTANHILFMSHFRLYLMLRSLKSNDLNKIYVPRISLRGTRGGRPACVIVGTRTADRKRLGISYMRNWQVNIKVCLKLKWHEYE